MSTRRGYFRSQIDDDYVISSISDRKQQRLADRVIECPCKSASFQMKSLWVIWVETTESAVLIQSYSISVRFESFEGSCDPFLLIEKRDLNVFADERFEMPKIICDTLEFLLDILSMNKIF